MNIKLRKPILIGGIGISMALWLWQSFLSSVVHFGELSVAGIALVGMGFWWLQKSTKNTLEEKALPEITKDTVEQAIAASKGAIVALETEAPNLDISYLKQQISNLPEAHDREIIKVAVTGGAKKIGKTKLKQVLESSHIQENLKFIETDSLCAPSEDEVKNAIETNLTADLVLFIATGDLTDSELQSLKRLKAENQRLLITFNKQDRYLPEERAFILQQLRQRVLTIAPSEDVIGISADPAQIKVRKHGEDGSILESMEQPEAEVNSLCDRLSEIVVAEKEQLLLTTTYREAIVLKNKAKDILNKVRRDRALPIVERYQSIAAAAAFANPVAALDLLATVAISGQMLVDLSEIYQQKFSLDQAKTASGTIGELMVKLGLVELSTQTVASVLKTNAITYVAGGAVQAVSAAYLTRIAGLSLIEYFQELEINTDSGRELNLGILGEKIQKIFQQNQRIGIVQNFVEGAIARLPQLKSSNSPRAASA